MALFHSTLSNKTARISLRRFAFHALLSALAAAIPQLLRYFAGAYLKNKIIILSWNATIICGFVTHHILWFRNSDDITTIYSVAASHLIASLHMITILLGKYLGDPNFGFTTRQHIAVHFCLAFYVITELEFYRAYANFKKFNTYTELFKHLHLANVDALFLYCREPFCYRIDLPDSWRRFLVSGNDPRTSKIISYASYLFFYMIGGLVNYPIKRMVNPGPGHDLLSAMSGLVLFGTYPAPIWKTLLGLALLRVMRQANCMGFRAMVESLKWWRGRQGTVGIKKPNDLESRYEICTNCGRAS